MKKNKYTKRKEVKKYNNKIIWKIVAISIALVIIASCTALYKSTSTSKLDNTVVIGKSIISLEAPSFIAVANETGGRDTSFLDDEAGISTYTNVGEEIDLEEARNAFRTIEYETDEYIVGSVPLPDYPAETEDVHCYVHIDGWIVSYYLNEEPVSKIVDWEDYTTAEEITGTKLEDGIDVVCNAAYVIPGEIKYYNFEWPIAEKLMIVADALWTSGEDTFSITLPSDFIFYERSYSHHYTSTSGASVMYINDDQISYLSDPGTNYDLLFPSELPTDFSNTIKITGSYSGDSFDAIVLIYRET